ncbi:2-C-methyl-D-erythritol 4-phosphate cytidylyltransferase [Fulvivirgaceae bacterium BMA12]|uniref:2-C-methyl-D-erythritol 4-phosphate cytidylyltransferase n=1 Tax=Agaribacillus aureus TaxID=3051825 RepID=A0ABT8LDT3_9BACT|nr:2-C-methyl-D-erythritol 4-phosphate cytidylyltransferase [Fulvivirgaceae bacterium BMA12]
MIKSDEYALIVAGGTGRRMKSDLPKQFLEISGSPILMHTIKAFYQYSNQIKIVLVLPEGDFDTWHELCQRHDFQITHQLQSGGNTRFQSVKRGLEKLPEKGLVAIHDGVRPLVEEATIATSFNLARKDQSAIAAVRLKESIRRVDNETSNALDRSEFRLIQTPQTFDLALIKQAYLIAEDQTLTDDASVVERAGYKISLFEGSYRNIKITTPEDLVIASCLMDRRLKG